MSGALNGSREGRRTVLRVVGAVLEIVLPGVGAAALMLFISRSWEVAIMSLAFGVLMGLDELYSGSQWHSALRRMQDIVPLIVFLVVLVLTGNVKAPSAYFAVSAQLVAILLVALALQSRVFNVKGHRSPRPFLVVYMAAYLAVGGYSSIVGLLNDGGNAALSLAAIAAGFASVVIAAMAGAPDD